MRISTVVLAIILDLVRPKSVCISDLRHLLVGLEHISEFEFSYKVASDLQISTCNTDLISLQTALEVPLQDVYFN